MLPGMPGDAVPSEGGVKTRRSLIGRLRDLNDHDSWQEFFDAYWKLIYSVARRAGCTEQEAEDVVQETTVTVTRCIQEFRYDPKVSSFKNWLMHKTHWRIIDQVRKRPPEIRHRAVFTDDSSPSSLIEHLPDPDSLCADAVWDEEWKKHLVEAAMDRVKGRVRPDHYQIFFLSAVRGLRPRPIAEALGVGIAQVYLVRHRVAALVRKEVRVLERRR